MSEEDKKDELFEEVKKLNLAIEDLKTKRFYRYANSPLRMVALSVIKGLIIGMATVVGAVALLALAIYLVGHLPFLPSWIQTPLNNALDTIERVKCLK